MSYITLYHYTDKSGAKGIAASRRIYQSAAPVDAVYGDGTYLTDKSPVKHTKLQIAQGNWDGTVQTADIVVDSGRTDFVFTITIKSNKVKLVDRQRHIWLYPGADLDLSDGSVVESWKVEETDKAEREAYQASVMAVSAGY